MIRVELICHDGTKYKLDAPDSTFIGPWLKAIFDQMQGGRPYVPADYTIRIS